MKNFRRIISEVAQPSSEDELNFKEKHVIDHILDPNSEEDQFTADSIQKFKNRADYAPGEDRDVYEDVTLARRALPGQESDDVDGDGDDDAADNQLRYRRHAQIKSKIIDEANAENKLKKNVHAAKLGHAADVTKSNYASKDLEPLESRTRKGETQSGRNAGLKTAVAKMLRAGRAQQKYGKDAGFIQTLNDFGRDIRTEDLDEAKMTDAQVKKREEIVMGLKKNAADLKKRYGKDWENAMYAIATKQAMNESDDAEWEKDSTKVKKSSDPKYVSKMIEKWGSRGSAWLSHPAFTKEVNEALDPVGKEDADVDNDGKITKSDAFLKARRKAIAKKLQQEGLTDVVEPIGGEYGDEEKSHVAYKKKNRKPADHRGEPVVESADLQEVSKKTLVGYARKAPESAEKMDKESIALAKLGKAVRGDGKSTAQTDSIYRKSGELAGKAGQRRQYFQKALDKIEKTEDVSMVKPKAGLRVFAGKTKQSDIAETFQTGDFKLRDGKRVNILDEEARLLNDLFNSLDESNQVKMMDIVESSVSGFESIVQFAEDTL